VAIATFREVFLGAGVDSGDVVGPGDEIGVVEVGVEKADCSVDAGEADDDDGDDVVAGTDVVAAIAMSARHFLTPEQGITHQRSLPTWIHRYHSSC